MLNLAITLIDQIQIEFALIKDSKLWAKHNSYQDGMLPGACQIHLEKG
jgi:hypothetical protein